LNEFEGLCVEIIPVIDLMGGVVVHAQGHERKQYKVLTSILSRHTTPKKVIADIVAFYPFKLFYIADLDAILEHALNLELYQQISRCFTDVTLLLDVGIQTQQQWNVLKEIPRIEPVIASESLCDLELLKKANQGVLSLDFQHGQFLGNLEILQKTDYWPKSIIVMNIDVVGDRSGPDFTLLKQVMDKRVDNHIIAAGGVRNMQDLLALERKGITATLIASALHSGEIGLLELKKLHR
jgi:phosphoribosylformimino-5-aminoimidazole carboxamide ribotide isomerase